MTTGEDLTFTLEKSTLPSNAQRHAYVGTVFRGDTFYSDTEADIITATEGLAFRLFFPEEFEGETAETQSDKPEQSDDSPLPKNEDPTNSKLVKHARQGMRFLESAKSDKTIQLPSDWISREKTHFMGLTTWVEFKREGKGERLERLEVFWRTLPTVKSKAPQRFQHLYGA